MTDSIKDNELIKKDDYICGKEYFGHSIKKVSGWVDDVHMCLDGTFYYNVQADDEYRGVRGTSIHSELGEIKKLPPKERPKR